MNTITLRRRARQLWDSPYNQRKWVRAVLQLGNKWLFAKPLNRV